MFMKKIEKVNFEKKKKKQMETNAWKITKYANN